MAVSVALTFLRIIFPIIAIIYYVAASVAVAFKPLDKRKSFSTWRYGRLFDLALTATVGLTYVIESITALVPSTNRQSDSYPLFCLYMSLLWLVVFLGAMETRGDDRRWECDGVWTIGVMFEPTIMILGAMDERTGTKGLVRLVLQLLRIAIMTTFATNAWGRYVYPNNVWHRVRSDEEENASLLAKPEEVVHLVPNGVDADYGTAQDRPDQFSGEAFGNSNEDAERDHDEDENDDVEATLSEIEQVKQNWWQYLSTFQRFLPYMIAVHEVRLRLSYLGLLIIKVAQRGLNILVPLSLGWVVDRLSPLEGKFPAAAIVMFLALRFLNSGVGLTWAEGLLWYLIERHCLLKLRLATYNHIMSLSYDFHSSKKSARLWQTVYQGSTVVSLFQTIAFQMLPMAIDLALAVLVFWFVFDGYIAFVVATGAVLFWHSTKISMPRKLRLRRTWVKTWQDEWEQMTESSSNWSTVAYFGQFSREAEKYTKCVLASQNAELANWQFQIVVEFVRSSILEVALLIACLLVANDIHRGRLQLGKFVVLITYWSGFTIPLTQISSSIDSIAKDLVDAEKLRNLLDTKPSIQDSAEATPFVFRSGEVTFNNVTFSYDGKRKVTENVSFTIRPGETVALVGETGGGKSTLLKLLYRFHDPDEGRILVDGQDLRAVTLETYRQYVGIVPQNPALFNMSVVENLRYPDLDTSEEKVQEVCKAVALHDKIMTFTKGYKQVVGEQGQKLSGGELQRVAIARAILKNPRILLLDEATSNVDIVTEKKIQASLQDLAAKRTTFIIAHRLSTIMQAHRVLVIKNGRIVEMGTHDELKKMQGGHYHYLWQTQMEAFFGKDRNGRESRSRSRFPMEQPVSLNDLSPTGSDGLSIPLTLLKEYQHNESAHKRSRSLSRSRKHRHKGHKASHDGESEHRGRASARSTAAVLRRQSESPEVAKMSVSAPISSTQLSTKLKADAPEFVPSVLTSTTRSASSSPTRSTVDLHQAGKRLPEHDEPHSNRTERAQSASKLDPIPEERKVWRSLFKRHNPRRDVHRATQGLEDDAATTNGEDRFNSQSPNEGSKSNEESDENQRMQYVGRVCRSRSRKNTASNSVTQIQGDDKNDDREQSAQLPAPKNSRNFVAAAPEAGSEHLQVSGNQREPQSCSRASKKHST